ncbi:MAG: carboxypeptidase-like regulatory domain-containing protein [Solirubrobacteraceae bacterium]
MSGVVLAMFGILFGPAPALAIDDGPQQPEPFSVEAPRLTGMPAVGQTLSCSQGVWANTPTGYSYRWLREGSPIAGQSASTYVVQSADVGNWIACEVVAGSAGGEYAIVGLPSGPYNVWFSSHGAGGYLPQYFSGKASSSEATSVAVTAGGATLQIDAAMSTSEPAMSSPGEAVPNPEDGQIEGTVTSASDGAPLADISVSAGNRQADGQATTNANGEYTIADLPAGSYNVGFSRQELSQNYLTQSEEVSVAAGSTTSGVDAAMQPGAQISGRVSVAADGAPLADIEVCAHGTTVEYWSCTTTNPGGEYTVSGLFTGSYNVAFTLGWESNGYNSRDNYAPQYYNGKALSSEAEAVAVVAGGSPALGIDAEMQPGGQISGTVTAAAGGGAVAGMGVCAYELPVSAPPGGPCAVTNASGEYTIVGLGSGSYEVAFIRRGFEGDNYLPQYGRDVSVTAGSTTAAVDAALFPAGVVTGRVTAASSGAVLANSEVCVGQSWPFFDFSGFDCATTNAAGEYTIVGLHSGSYNVKFYPYKGGNYLPQSEEVSVTAGSTTAGVDAALPPGGVIAGSVTAASGGAALAGIEVCTNKTSPGDGEGCAVTNRGGSNSATSNALPVPVPGPVSGPSVVSAAGGFSLVRAPSFDAKTGDLDFYFKLAGAGRLGWSLAFRGAEAGIADSLSSAFGGAIGDDLTRIDRAVIEALGGKNGRCKAGYLKYGGRCVRAPMSLANGSKSFPAGTVEVKVHAGARAIEALKAGRTLYAGGPFEFQSALGGAPVTRTVAAMVRWPKSKTHGAKRIA